ncbi:hypothetical protein NC661_12615 [Aquibacillus koreensis]|uniref:Uncharacterized protein n=1 Tax=Aquibacillus koreensis TaxID=279446 RepID=A0A9X3WPT1_9BACI|nr:hypothetical protein [Aquibacillus koreensis]MCT2537752.1 hypothetical protein [Aquibacillus koreensis]MDC3421214.1 hypothetical protein [Aquibacillus koreensis]
METFLRGSLYITVGVIFLLLFAIITDIRLNIPYFLFIPFVLFAFLIASKKANLEGGDGGGVTDHSGYSYNESGEDE